MARIVETKISINISAKMSGFNFIIIPYISLELFTVITIIIPYTATFNIFSS